MRDYERVQSREIIYYNERPEQIAADDIVNVVEARFLQGYEDDYDEERIRSEKTE